jgi:uncharacterized protein
MKYQIRRFRALSGDPTALASGSALGVFMGIMPVFPFRTILIVLVGVLFKVNLLAAIILATICANPLVILVWYYLALLIGNALTPYVVDWERVEIFVASISGLSGFQEKLAALAQLGVETIVVLLVGGVAIALPFSLVTFFAVRYITFRRSPNGTLQASDDD